MPSAQHHAVVGEEFPERRRSRGGLHSRGSPWSTEASPVYDLVIPRLERHVAVLVEEEPSASINIPFCQRNANTYPRYRPFSRVSLSKRPDGVRAL